MSIKNILIHLDDTNACEGRIDVALCIAREHAATVTGISILTHDYYQPRQTRTQETQAASGDLLLTMARAAGVAAVWRVIESAVVGVSVRELLIRNSHCFDLVIVSQEPDKKAGSVAMVEDLVLCAGRPVLVVPSVGTFPSVGKRILVAWKNGREAARAMNDSLPLLKKAGQVTLLSIASSEEAGQDPWEGILEHLQRHGIQAGTRVQPATSAPMADSLLNMSCEGGFDLLVMGAYKPETRRKSQFGKIADQILREMTIPVLMSH